MKTKLLLCLAVLLSGHLFAGELGTNRPSQTPAHIWEYINYPVPTNLSREPFFLVSSSEQYDQVSRGLRLDIQNIVQGFRFIRTNGVTARLYRADGEVCEPTEDGKRWLKTPVASSTGSYPGERLIPGVMTWFPWGSNTLEEAWIEVTIGPERYWLEIPYGFDRNPADPPSAAVPDGPPQFVPAMKSLTGHDHVVGWKNVEYDLAQTNHEEITLKQANPFDAESEVVLYSDASAWRLDSPKTAVRIRDANGAVRNGTCVDLHLSDDHWQRIDTFQFGRYGDDLRCWGQIQVNVDDHAYRVVVPSSLYKSAHGHVPLKNHTIEAHEP